jgi:hypothetical protein
VWVLSFINSVALIELLFRFPSSAKTRRAPIDVKKKIAFHHQRPNRDFEGFAHVDQIGRIDHEGKFRKGRCHSMLTMVMSS